MPRPKYLHWIYQPIAEAFIYHYHDVLLECGLKVLGFLPKCTPGRPDCSKWTAAKFRSVAKNYYHLSRLRCMEEPEHFGKWYTRKCRARAAYAYFGGRTEGVTAIEVDWDLRQWLVENGYHDGSPPEPGPEDNVDDDGEIEMEEAEEEQEEHDEDLDSDDDEVEYFEWDYEKYPMEEP